MELDPELLAASFNAARSLAEAGDYDRALNILGILLAREPENIRVIAARAYVLYKAGRPRDALGAYEAALRLAPTAPDIVYNAALLKLAAGDAAGAADDLAPLLEALPEDAEALRLGARASLAAGRKDEALGRYEALRASSKASAADLEALGSLYEGARQFAKALEAYDAAVRLEAGLASAWFALARIRLAEANDGTGGLEALAKALEAGFQDKAAATALLESPALLEREAVLKALREKGLGE